MNGLKVHPLHVGTIKRPIAMFCHGLEPGVVSDLPVISWYIEGSDKRILVDTGGGDPSQASPLWLPYKREEDQTIENILKKFNLTCGDIDIVIVTHLHWDHTGGNTLFPKAKIIVQEQELHWARSLEAIRTHLPTTLEDIDYTVVSGDVQIADGVKVILTPGHTYGLQGVLIRGQARPLFIPSDTLPLYKNVETDPFQISDVYVDLEAYGRSVKRIANLSAAILPCHDFRVLTHDFYS
jgi:N-acyl homoserine lactone hydrolase